MKILYPLNNPYVTQPYGAKNDIYVDGIHKGVDFRAKMNTSIYAAEDGIVSFVNGLPNRSHYGRYIVIEHENNYQTLYAHLNQCLVKEGEEVIAAQQIALSGNSTDYPKYSTGPHLHFEFMQDYNKIDPAPYFKLTPQAYMSDLEDRVQNIESRLNYDKVRQCEDGTVIVHPDLPSDKPAIIGLSLDNRYNNQPALSKVDKEKLLSEGWSTIKE